MEEKKSLKDRLKETKVKVRDWIYDHQTGVGMTLIAAGGLIGAYFGSKAYKNGLETGYAAGRSEHVVRDTKNNVLDSILNSRDGVVYGYTEDNGTKREFLFTATEIEE